MYTNIWLLENIASIHTKQNKKPNKLGQAQEFKWHIFYIQKKEKKKTQLETTHTNTHTIQKRAIASLEINRYEVHVNIDQIYRTLGKRMLQQQQQQQYMQTNVYNNNYEVSAKSFIDDDVIIIFCSNAPIFYFRTYTYSNA